MDSHINIQSEIGGNFCMTSCEGFISFRMGVSNSALSDFIQVIIVDEKIKKKNLSTLHGHRDL